MEGPGADSEEKRVLASDLDTVMVDSLKALDLIRPIREADIGGYNLLWRSPVPWRRHSTKALPFERWLRLLRCTSRSHAVPRSLWLKPFE